MKTCPKCQTVLNDTAKFCRKCGFNIKQYEEENAAQESFCTECGAKIPSDSVFCPECGTSIGSELACDTVSTETIGGFDFSALELEAQNQLNEQNLSAFEYEKMSNDKYIIKKLKNKSELTIIVPDCVQIIESNAFADSSVIDVTLPEGLIKIGAGAFSGCKDLETINIPSSLKIIEDEAFSGCIELDMEEPHNVRCGKDAFKNTRYSIRVEEERKRKEEEERKRKYTAGLAFEWDGGSNKVRKYYGTSADVLIPAIYNDLPVTRIGKDAFEDCSSLESITIPDSVTSIGAWAFAACKSLKSITISDSVTSICNSTFSGCSSLTSITIPDSVTSIGELAFYGCSSLTSVTIGDSVTTIGGYAFKYCENLTSVTIPNSVTTIGYDAFSFCKKLTSITFEGTKAQWQAISKGSLWNYPTGKYTIYCTDGTISK